MTQEQIEQAACKHAINKYCVECDKRRYISCQKHGDGCGLVRPVHDAFLAGAESRQAEIDELKNDIEHYKADIASGAERERIAALLVKQAKDLMRTIQ